MRGTGKSGGLPTKEHQTLDKRYIEGKGTWEKLSKTELRYSMKTLINEIKGMRGKRVS